MASKLTKVSVILESVADLKGIKAFNAGMARVDQATKKLGPSLQFVKGVMGGLAAVGGIAGGALIGAGKAAMDYASSIQDAADQSGASTTAIQSLAYVAQQNGASLDEMNKALIQLTKASAEAAAGNEEAAAKFARLGIDAKAFAALRPEEQMERLGRAILGAGNEQEALAAAMDLVGAKNAPKLMASLRQLGSEGYAAVEQSARQAGQVMSTETIQALDKAQDRIAAFTTKVTILAGEWLRLSAIAFNGDNQLAKAAEALAEAEEKTGLKSKETAKARLEYIDALIKEGKVKQAQLELDRTPERVRSGAGRGFGDDPDYAKKRAAAAAALAKAQSEEQAKAARQAANAQKDAEEKATVDADAAKKKAAKEEEDRIKELAKEYERYAKKKIAAEEKAADEALKIAQDNAEQLRAAQESAATGDRNELVKRGLALGGQDLTGGPAFIAPKMPEAPKAATPVVEFTIPKDLSVQGIDALKALLTSIDRRLAAGSAQPSFGD